MRKKYRSAVYVFTTAQYTQANGILGSLQQDFEDKLITEVYGFKEFKISPEPFQNYYLKNPNKPFCKTYIDPKLQMLLRRFPKNAIEPPLIPHKTVEE
jgi:peptide-methionine (S)-S-oxide reductase